MPRMPRPMNKARLVLNRAYSTGHDYTEYRCNKTYLCNWNGPLKDTIEKKNCRGCPTCGERVVLAVRQ
jgi:hypothetical protein